MSSLLSSMHPDKTGQLILHWRNQLYLKEPSRGLELLFQNRLKEAQESDHSQLEERGIIGGLCGMLI